MKSKFRSLRLDIIFDLSLLTLCALLLSEAFIIVLLRREVPAELSKAAPQYLSSIHHNVSSRWKTHKGKRADIQENLAESLPEGPVRAEVAPFQTEDLRATDQTKILLTRHAKFLGIFSYPHEFVYIDEIEGGPRIAYRWSLHSFQTMLTQFKYRVFFTTLLIEIVLVLLAYAFLFRRNVILPINQLSRVANEFLRENWSARFDLDRPDELGRIGEALNEMAQKIQEKERKLVLTIESLREANEELEVRQNEQLQIEKLASIGRLAAGVAHEVGNPLGAISGYVDILRRSLKKMPSASLEDIDLCDHIENETNRISKIIRALLQQARPTRERLKPVSLKPVLVRCVHLAQIPSAIDVSYEFEDDEAEAFAEEDQLVQIFLNLLINAKHAIDARKDRAEAGRLRIRCSQRKLPLYRNPGEHADYDTSVVRALKPEVYWVVNIEDNGVGITEEDQKKLFEPFFSTKAPGKGTGLGLYVAKSIIESFRGAIVVRSASGYGATFSIFLPKAKDFMAGLITEDDAS